MFDKFHDECGVVAIYAHPEAEKLAYLGLHALQHRGQESAGIVTSNGLTLRAHRAMGLVADIFTEDVLSQLHGTLAIGHTRYSTAGDSALLQCSAHHGAIEQGHDCAGAQRQPGECAGNPASPGGPGIDLSDQQRHRSHRSPDRALQGTDAAGGDGRRAAPRRRRVFAGDDQFGPDLCGARSARLPSAGHGKNSPPRRTAAGHHRVCLRNLRLRSDRRHLRTRRQAGRTGDRRTGRHHVAVLFSGGRRSRAAFSSMCISRGPTAWCLGARCKPAAKNWDDNWRGKRRPRPTSLFRCRTPA